MKAIVPWWHLDVANDYRVVHNRAQLPIGVEGKGVILFDHLVAAGVKPRACQDDSDRADTPPLWGDARKVHLCQARADPPLTGRDLKTHQLPVDSETDGLIREEALAMPAPLICFMQVDLQEMVRLEGSRALVNMNALESTPELPGYLIHNLGGKAARCQLSCAARGGRSSHMNEQSGHAVCNGTAPEKGGPRERISIKACLETTRGARRRPATNLRHARWALPKPLRPRKADGADLTSTAGM